MPVRYCSSLIWTCCVSYFMPWSCLEWDIGNWRLCAWFQCMQPYMLWWLLFHERSFLKMNPRLRMIPSNSILLLLREIVCECCIAMLTEDDGEKQIASVYHYSVWVWFLQSIAQYLWHNLEVNGPSLSNCQVIQSDWAVYRLLFQWGMRVALYTKWTLQGSAQNLEEHLSPGRFCWFLVEICCLRTGLCQLWVWLCHITYKCPSN